MSHGSSLKTGYAWDRGGPSVRTAAGVMLMVASMAAFALYTVLSKKAIGRHGAIVLTAFASLLGGLFLLPMTWAGDGPPWRGLTPWHWLAVAHLAAFATAAAYAAYFHGMSRVSASRASMLFFAKPVLAALLAWFLLTPASDSLSRPLSSPRDAAILIMAHASLGARASRPRLS